VHIADCYTHGSTIVCTHSLAHSSTHLHTHRCAHCPTDGRTHIRTLLHTHGHTNRESDCDANGIAECCADNFPNGHSVVLTDGPADGITQHVTHTQTDARTLLQLGSRHPASVWGDGCGLRRRVLPLLRRSQALRGRSRLLHFSLCGGYVRHICAYRSSNGDSNYRTYRHADQCTHCCSHCRPNRSANLYPYFSAHIHTNNIAFCRPHRHSNTLGVPLWQLLPSNEERDSVHDGRVPPCA
jgi:hypothetical protein